MEDAEFDLHADLEDEHWWFRARREIILDALKRHSPPRAGAKVLEIGCGTGGNLRLFARDYEVAGIDIAPHAVERARARCQCEISCGDARELMRGRWHEVSAVVLADVLEHVADDHRFFADLVAGMAKGTTIVVTVPSADLPFSGHDVALGHHRRYTRAGLQTVTAQPALRQLCLSSFNTLLFPLIRLARGASGQSGSNLRRHGALANRLLYSIFSLERPLLRTTGLPFGASLLAVLRKDN